MFYYVFEKFKLLKFSGGAFEPPALPPTGRDWSDKVAKGKVSVLGEFNENDINYILHRV